MRLWINAASKEGAPGGRHLKAVHAADPVETPGKLAVPEREYSGAQARRQAVQGAIFLGLLAILAYYGMQVWLRGTEAANRKVCRGNLHALGLSLQMYQQDHDGVYPPPDAGLVRSLRSYLPGPSCLICPSDDLARPSARRKRRVPTRVAISYTYWPPRGANPEMRLDVAMTPLLWDYNGGIPSGPHHQGGNVLYLDGHVRWRRIYFWSSANQPW